MSHFLEVDDNLARRKRKEKIMRTVLMAGASLSVLALAVLLLRMAADGIPHMSWEFWSQRYSPRGINSGNSGILDSIISSFIVLLLAMLFAIPVGTAAGVYLYEYAPANRLTTWIRATVSNLAAVPSVVYGLLGLAIFVRLWADLNGGVPEPTNIAGALTLGVLVLPIVIVATEEALKTVPDSVRQASLAMGATKWQTVRNHVLPYALPGILTGQILALSRAAGETAPLLVIGTFTYVTAPLHELARPDGLGTPLQVRAYALAADARTAAIEMGAATIVVLLLATLLLNLAAIFLRDRLQKKIQW